MADDNGIIDDTAEDYVPESEVEANPESSLEVGSDEEKPSDTSESKDDEKESGLNIQRLIMYVMAGLLIIIMALVIYNMMVLSTIEKNMVINTPESTFISDKETEGKPATQVIKLDEITVSLANKAVDKILTIKMNVEIDEDADLGALFSYLAPVKDEMITLLSSRMSYGMMTSQGKDKLREELLELINRVLDGKTTAHSIKFVNFVIS